jgi:hypothetical protein
MNSIITFYRNKSTIAVNNSMIILRNTLPDRYLKKDTTGGIDDQRIIYRSKRNDGPDASYGCAVE